MFSSGCAGNNCMLADHCHSLFMQTVLHIGELVFLARLRCIGTISNWLQSMIWSVIEEVSDRFRSVHA